MENIFLFFLGVIGVVALVITILITIISQEVKSISKYFGRDGDDDTD